MGFIIRDSNLLLTTAIAQFAARYDHGAARIKGSVKNGAKIRNRMICSEGL